MVLQGRILKRSAQATALIVATACLLSNVASRESFPDSEHSHPAIGRRGLLADQTFDVGAQNSTYPWHLFPSF